MKNKHFRCPNCNFIVDDSDIIKAGAQLMAQRSLKKRKPYNPERLKKQREILEKARSKRWGKNRKDSGTPHERKCEK